MMKRIFGLFTPALVAGFLLAALTGAQAQNCSGQPNANTICAGPTTGGSGFPNFRAMVGADVPAGIVANSSLANMAAGTIKANPTGGAAAPSDWAIGASTNVNSSGLNGFSGQQLYIFRSPSSVDTLQASLRVDRSPTYTGGTPGNVFNAIFGYMNPTANVADFQWAILGQVDNSATAGQNVGVYGQGNKITSGAGPTWGGVMQAIEKAGQINPTTGTVGLEVDLSAVNTDTNGNRVVLDLVGQNLSAGVKPTITYALRMGAGNAANFTTGIFFASSTTFSRGIDFSGATFSTSQVNGIGWSVDGSGNINIAAGEHLLLNATTQIDGTFSTGAATPVLSTNKPGANGGVTQWLSVKINGTQLWVPAFSN